MFGKSMIAALVLIVSGVAQAADLALEPCVNGGVSRTGIWPTQLMEPSDTAELNWQSYDTYYLFAVSASYLESPFDRKEELGEMLLSPADAEVKDVNN